MMPEPIKADHCLMLRVGVIAKGGRCLTIMRMLDAIKPKRLRLKLVGLAPVTKQIACYKFAGEMGIPIYDDHRELVAAENLDLLLEMTGNASILSDIAQRKAPSVGLLDRQSSMLFFDLAEQYEYVAEREQEIGLTSSFASALLEASPDGVLVTDRNHRVINCNNSALATRGLGRDGAIGKYCYELLHGELTPCEASKRDCPIAETLKTHRPARAVHEIVSLDGEIRICHVTTYPLFNRLGEIVQFVNVIRDITTDLSERIEQSTAAIRHDLAQVAQEDRLASLGRLVASVCHEINNPISSIVTFNKLMLSYITEGTMPPEGLQAFNRFLNLSIKEAMRCGHIVKHLLTFARQRRIEPRHINLTDIVNTIVTLAAHQLEMADIRYEVRLPPTPLGAWGDFSLIQQCLLNLIFNAMDAMPDGGRLVLEAGLADGGGQVWITVADSGHGIAAEDQSRIFEPFYSTKDEGKGVGLGLSMVYGIIREHNGTIDVDSTMGKGTVFTITLPVRSE